MIYRIVYIIKYSFFILIVMKYYRFQNETSVLLVKEDIKYGILTAPLTAAISATPSDVDCFKDT